MGSHQEPSAATADPLLLDLATRATVWARVTREIDEYIDGLPAHRVSAVLDPTAVRVLLAEADFATPMLPERALDLAVRGLWDYQTHTAHPRCFGLFVPTPTTMGIAADALVAAFNPQLANWAHSPFANEVERHVLDHLARRIGYATSAVDGCFTSGGAESNHTAIVAALFARFPEVRSAGLWSVQRRPVLYASAEAHDSTRKAARLAGLGDDAVRTIATDSRLRMDVTALRERIARDRADACAPFMIVGTAGSTNAGAIDPLEEIADVARANELWFHVDGAWGAAAAIAPELRAHFAGLERADSLSLDAHKWMSVPMGAGILLTTRPGILDETFSVTTSYMPRDAEGLPVRDAYQRSMQWSRRFIGLKLFLTLAVAGWEGYAARIRRQAALGDVLRTTLAADGWHVVNDTPLPVVCFVDGTHTGGADERYLRAVMERVLQSGRAWLSTTRLSSTGWALRACISSMRTESADLDALRSALTAARLDVRD